MCLSKTVAQAEFTFVPMTTYYCRSIEEALRRAKNTARRLTLFYGGITLPSGRKGFAVYRDGKVIEQYSYLKNS